MRWTILGVAAALLALTVQCDGPGDQETTGTGGARAPTEPTR